MKCRATEKEIRNSFSDVVRIGYCNAQNLLICENPFAYTCGAKAGRLIFTIVA